MPYDPGIDKIEEALARALGLPLYMQRYARQFRGRRSPTLDLFPGPDGWALPVQETDEERERTTERARMAHRLLKRR